MSRRLIFFMHAAQIRVALVVALFSTPALFSAELVIRDLQAVVLVEPTAFDYTLETPTFTRSGSDAFDSGTGLELGGRYSISRVGDPMGLVLGLDATTDAYGYQSQDLLFSYGARGSVGIGYAFNDDWTVTGDLGISYGKTNLTLPASASGPAVSADGTYRGYDVRVVGMYQAAKHLCVSLQAGYMFASHDLTTDNQDKLTLDQQGPCIGIGLTWRFSSAPERVE